MVIKLLKKIAVDLRVLMIILKTTEIELIEF